MSEAPAPEVPTAPTPPASPPATVAEEVPWKGLHPLSLVVNVFPTAWRTLRGAWPLLIALFVGGQGVGMRAVDVAILTAFAATTLLRTTVHFLTLRYRVVDDRFEVKAGLLNRRSRKLDPQRIQNIELVRNLFHRATGLVEVRVETAGDASSEGLLSALSIAEAEELRRQLRAARQRARLQAADPEGDDPTTETAAPAGHDDDVARGTPVATIGTLELIAYGLSRRTIGTVAVLTAVGMEVFAQLDPRDASQAIESVQGTFLVAVFLLAFAGSWVFSAGQAVLRHHGYRLVDLGDRLLSTEGLTTTRRVEIPLRKVQLVRTDEPWLRRMMGYGSVLIETAALGFADGKVRQAEVVIPMVEREVVGGVLGTAIPRIDLDPWQATLLPAHPRALYRMVVAALARVGLITGFSVWIFGIQGLLALFLVPAAVPYAWLEWKRQGWAVTPAMVVTRLGWLTRRTWVLDRDKVQSVHVLQSPTMRIHGLARVVVRAAGTDVGLPLVGLPLALEVTAELSPEPGEGPDQLLAPPPVQPPPGSAHRGEQQAHGEHAADDTGHVGAQAGEHGVPGA